MLQNARVTSFVLAGWFLSLGPQARSQDYVIVAAEGQERADQINLRQKIFGKKTDQPTCKPVSTGKNVEKLALIDAKLAQLASELIKGIETNDSKALLPLFHPRLNIGLPAVEHTLAKIHSTYVKPLDLSVYKLWALDTKDGSPKGITCKDENVTVYPQYGYPLQFALWLQAMGQKELGRIFVSIVPAGGKWNIGAFDAQQWTHEGKDFTGWIQEAVAAGRANHKLAAFIKYDMAAKLVGSSRFLDIASKNDIVTARDALLKRDDWDKQIKGILSKWKVAFVNSLFVKDGAGLLVRVRIEEEMAVQTMRTTCQKMVETIMKETWHQELKGMRCSFVLPHEDASKEGILGGLYLSFADARKDGNSP